MDRCTLEQSLDKTLRHTFDQVINGQPIQPNIVLSHPYFSIIHYTGYTEWFRTLKHRNKLPNCWSQRAVANIIPGSSPLSHGGTCRTDKTLWPTFIGRAFTVMFTGGVWHGESTCHPARVIVPSSFNQGPLQKNCYGPNWAIRSDCTRALLCARSSGLRNVILGNSAPLWHLSLQHCEGTLLFQMLSSLRF